MGFLSKEVCYKNCKLLKEHNPSIDGVTFGRKHGSRKFECWCERPYTGVDTRLPMMEKWITRSLMWINGDGVGASEIKMADADTAELCYEKCMLRMKSRQDSGIDGVTFGKKTGDRKNECYCEIGMTGTNTKADYAARWMTRSFPTIPVDGSFGRWSLFSKCSKDCGGGQMTRSRSCDSPKPQHGGKDCVGDKIETKACNTQNCPTEPEEGKWILQKKDVCFAAKGNKPGFFDIQKVDGKLDGIKLVHKSGSVSCALFGDSNWGCNGNNIGVLV